MEIGLRSAALVHSIKKFEARVGRNPKSGQKVPVEEKIKPVFRAGKELKLRINK